jgi:PIN domain nuclease of toxin-antitoxin system
MHEIDLTIKNYLENYVNLNLKKLDISTHGIEYEIELGFNKIANEVKEGFDRLIKAQSK